MSDADTPGTVPAAAEPLPRTLYAYDFERAIDPGKAEFSFNQLANLSSSTTDALLLWWTAAGFPAIPDHDQVMFTEADLELSREVSQLVQSGAVDPAALIPAAQSLGQAMSRLTEWQAPLLATYARLPGLDPDDVAPTLARAVDRIDKIQRQVWRRHLAVATRRLVTTTADAKTARLAVGFADMVGYTRLSRGLALDELNVLVNTFEQDMHTQIYRHGGWIIKGVGDEVMFAAEDPGDAARIALALQEPREHPELVKLDLELPQLRVGVAFGEVLTRNGDVFGTVVNLAARLTSAARPGTTLVDGAVAEAIAAEPDVDSKSLRAYRARGFSAVHPHLLKRPKGWKAPDRS
jgi:adenylate cyclase